MEETGLAGRAIDNSIALKCSRPSEEVLNMVSRIACTVAAVAALGSFMLAQDTVVAKVPFTFQVNQQVLPAGNYTFEQLQSEDLKPLSIHGEGKNVVALSSTVGESNGVAKLAFRRIGNQYVLTRIAGQNFQRDLTLSAEQRKLARNSTESVVLAGK
jgi:hypothetical protein